MFVFSEQTERPSCVPTTPPTNLLTTITYTITNFHGRPLILLSSQPVDMGGLEPPACSLQKSCSPIELHTHICRSGFEPDSSPYDVLGISQMNRLHNGCSHHTADKLTMTCIGALHQNDGRGVAGSVTKYYISRRYSI